MTQAWDGVKNLVNGYYYGNQLDFVDTSQQNILNSISDPTNYATCTAGGFQTDSWVPTTLTPRTISCKSSLPNLAGAT